MRSIPDKSHIPYYNFRKDCLLSLPSRLVYSHLVYRLRLNRGASGAELREALRLHPTTVRAALDDLTAAGFVVGVRAADPPPSLDWFVSLKTGRGKWFDRQSRFPHHLPSHRCRLTTQQQIVYSYCRNLSGRERSLSYRALASIIGDEDRNIRYALRKLEREGMVRTTVKGNRVWLEAVALDDEHLAWFADQQSRPAVIDPEQPAVVAAYSAAADINRLCLRMIEDGVPNHTVRDAARSFWLLGIGYNQPAATSSPASVMWSVLLIQPERTTGHTRTTATT